MKLSYVQTKSYSASSHMAGSNHIARARKRGCLQETGRGCYFDAYDVNSAPNVEKNGPQGDDARPKADAVSGLKVYENSFKGSPQTRTGRASSQRGDAEGETINF